MKKGDACLKGKMRKICIVLSSDYLSEPKGGGERVMAIAKGLREDKFDVSILIPSSKNPSSKKLNGIDIHMVVSMMQDTSLLGRFCTITLTVLKARKIWKRYGVILQFENAALAGYAALIGIRNYILDVHDLGFDAPLFEERPLLRKSLYHFEKMGIKHASKIIVVSSPMKNFIVKEWGVPENKITIVPNGVFESELITLKKTFQNIKEEEGAVSFIGFLNPRLDVDKFIKVGLLLKNRGGRLYIIGEGPIKNLLEKRIKGNNLENTIILTGYLPRMEAYTLLAKSQVTIFPLRAQKSINMEVMCPVKVLKYAALGKPMVLDDVSELCKIFKENNAALVSNPHNPSEFIKNVNALLDDENMRKKLGENAKNLAKIFYWERLTEKLADIYEDSIIG